MESADVTVNPLGPRFRGDERMREADSISSNFACSRPSWHELRLRAAESTRRPLGADDLLSLVERRLGRSLRPRKPGPKPRIVAPSGQLEMGIQEMS